MDNLINLVLSFFLWGCLTKKCFNKNNFKKLALTFLNITPAPGFQFTTHRASDRR